MVKKMKKKIVYGASTLAMMMTVGSQSIHPEIAYSIDNDMIAHSSKLAVYDYKEASRYDTEYDLDGTTMATDSRQYITDSFGAINVQSVGKYRTQEGAKPNNDGIAELAWDIQWAPLYQGFRESPENITWIFVPNDLKNIKITAINDDLSNTLDIVKKVPKTLKDFGNILEETSAYSSALEVDMKNVDKEVLEKVGIASAAQSNYRAIAVVSNNYYGNVRVSGEIDTQGANSDVYVPLRASNKLTSFKEENGEQKVIGLSHFSWSDMGTLPDFSISDESVNNHLGELYARAINQTAGLDGSDKCVPTINSTNEDKDDGSSNFWMSDYKDVNVSNDYNIVPENERESFRKFLGVSTAESLIEKFIVNTRISNEDGCDQSAHRILIDKKPVEDEPIPSPSESPTPSPDPSPSESPTPSPSESPTPSPSESPTPSPNEEPTPDPSGTPKTDTPTPPVIPTPEPKGTESTPTTTEKTTEPGVRIIENKTEPKHTPPVVNHMFPEKQPVPQNPSRVNTSPFVPVQPAAIPGPVSQHGPVVNTGGTVQESFWTKIANLFR